VLGADLPAARAEQASAWREGLHPREAKGSPKGGEFAPKAGGVRRQTVRGKPVYTAQLTPEQRQANLDSLKAAKTRKVEGTTRLKVAGGVTTQEIPRQWLVDQGYAVPSSRGSLYGGDGVIQLKRDLDQEAVLVHYLSGKKPENYPVGSKGFDQFMYGRQLPAGASKQERERMRTIRAKNKGERAAVIRRITAALVAAGIEEMRAHALVAAAFVEEKHPRHPKGSEAGGEFRPKGGGGSTPSELSTPPKEREELADAVKQLATKPDDKAAQERVKAAAAAARAAGADDKEIAAIAYEASSPKKDVKLERPKLAETLKGRDKPLERAWDPGTAMGDIEDMTYGTESDAELGRKLREYYRKRTSELGETQKRSPGI